MSLYMNPSLRSAYREVLDWERKNPSIVAKDAEALIKMGKKREADAIKIATTPIVRVKRPAAKFSPYSEQCPHCGATFWKAHHSRRYCSSTCQVAAGRPAQYAAEKAKRAKV